MRTQIKHRLLFGIAASQRCGQVAGQVGGKGEGDRKDKGRILINHIALEQMQLVFILQTFSNL